MLARIVVAFLIDDYPHGGSADDSFRDVETHGRLLGRREQNRHRAIIAISVVRQRVGGGRKGRPTK